MGRPTIQICRTCEASRHAPDGERDRADGNALFRAVKERRKERGLKEVFRLEGVDCLKQCKEPCAVMFFGKKRSTYLRVYVDARVDVDLVVDAACRYAALEPGEEIPERGLPGESAD